jgi:oxaloacetate decarboxylase gamma subunit
MDELLSEGLSLMVYGMGFVIVFLTLLVIATSAMSRIVMRFEPVPVPKTASKAKTMSSNPADDAQLIAVMTAAIHKFRNDRKGQ